MLISVSGFLQLLHVTLPSYPLSRFRLFCHYSYEAPLSFGNLPPYSFIFYYVLKNP